MKSKASNPAAALGKNTSPMIDAYFNIAHLKQLYRQGWLLRGISTGHCESVADHTFGVAVLAMILAKAYFPHLDQTKVLQMALVHDLGEIHAGDIVPGSGINPREKHQLEKESVDLALGQIAGADAFRSLWDEYEAGESPEASFIRQIDKLEMALQASIYEHQYPLNLEDFFRSAGNAIETEELQQILREAENLREER